MQRAGLVQSFHVALLGLANPLFSVFLFILFSENASRVSIFVDFFVKNDQEVRYELSNSAAQSFVRLAARYNEGLDYIS